MWPGDLLFWSNLFGVVCTSILIATPFFKLRKFPSMILLKIFYRPLSWVSSPSFILISLRFVFFFLHSVPDFLNILCQGFCSWDKATTVGREVRRRKSMRCTEKAAASVPLRSWGWDWRIRSGRRKGKAKIFGSLVGVICGSAGGICCSWGLG